MEFLEARRLFAADLAVVGVTSEMPFAQPRDSNDRHITIKNVGDATFDGDIEVDYILTKDKIVGNADDIQPGYIDTALTLTPGQTRDVEAGGGLPDEDDLPAGRYFLAARIRIITGTDASAANNTLADQTLEVYTGEWPSASISGTAGNDVILIGKSEAQTVVSVNGVTHSKPNGQLFIDGGAGDDKIVAVGTLTSGLLITGSGGRDTIVGGNQNDSISGGNGRDKILGGAGDDQILGGAQGDWLFGEFGSDTLSGAGGNDRISDIYHSNYLLGGAGNDVFVCRSSGTVFTDNVSGGTGFDRAQLDDADGRASIEELIA